MTQASPFPSGDRFYETIVHSLGGIVWAANPETFQFTFVSEQAGRILGYPVREWLDPGFWRRHTHPDDIERCTAFCRDATLNGRDHTFEYRMLAADGRVVWLRDIVTVRTEANATVRLVGIMLDITEAKGREEEQRETHALYRFLAENTNDVITLQDLEGRIVYASASYVRMFGRTSETGFDLVHPDDLETIRGSWERVVRGETMSASFRCIHPDGFWLWVESRGWLTDYHGAPHVLAVTRDLTDRRRLENELRQAQKMEAIGLLAGGVAHDFNNLLTVILGYAELLGELVKEPRTHAVVEEIRHACDRAVVLTQQLLAFSRKQVLNPAVIDLNEVIGDVVRMLSRIIGESIQVTVTTAGAVPPVLVDAGQVHQVVTNLAVNARDAMPAGGRLTIETSALRTPAADAPPELPPGRYAIVSVTDTGSGIEPSVLPRIFEPFFTTKEPGKGTGLGLSTAYGIMKQSGGHIDVRSKVGAGTTFTLYFPETSLAPSSSPPQEKPAAPAAPAGELVLLVEDEDQVRSLVARALEKDGYRVRSAGSGREALEVARATREPFALVVTDVVMPGMSGPEMIRRLETLRPGLRVLYISGYAGDSVLREGVSEPGMGFLQKPFAAKHFLRKVRQLIDEHREAPAPGDTT